MPRTRTHGSLDIVSRRNQKTIQQLAYEAVTQAIGDPAGKHILEVGV